MKAPKNNLLVEWEKEEGHYDRKGPGRPKKGKRHVLPVVIFVIAILLLHISLVLVSFDIPEDTKESNSGSDLGNLTCFKDSAFCILLDDNINISGTNDVEHLRQYLAFVIVPEIPECGNVDRINRNGKRFSCLVCGHADDADYVGTQNLEALGLAGGYRLRSLQSGG